MAVIIDTFEVINDSEAAAEKPKEKKQAASKAGSPLKPGDIEAVLLHQHLRNDRLRAH